jgi:hypothetical protein
MDPMDSECVFAAILDDLLNDASDHHIALLEVAESKNTSP